MSLACLMSLVLAVVPDSGMGWNPRTPRPTDAEVRQEQREVIARIEAAGYPYVTPAMLGDDSPRDDTELVRWAILVSRAIQRPLWIDRSYGVSGVLEIQDGQTWYGNGPYSPGLFRINDKIASGDYRKDAPAIIQAPDAKTFAIRDLQIDGRQSEVPWDEVKSADLSNVLRNSPSFAGLAFTNQSGRAVPERVYLDRVRVHNMPGSCLLAQCDVYGSALELGNSVSGRIAYRMRGTITGLYTWGFSRTSVARISSGATIIGWKYRGRGQRNPWPENARPDNIAAVERLDGEGDETITLIGLDWDGADSEFRNGLAIGQNCFVQGSIRNLGYPVFAHPKNDRGPVTATVDIRTENCRPPRLHFPSATTGANFRNLDLRWVNRTTDRATNSVDWSYNSSSYRVWSRQVNSPIEISVARQSYHAPNHEQRISIQIDDDWPAWCLLHVPDLYESGRLRRPDDMIPTYVRLSGRIDNRLSVWIATRRGINEQHVPTAEDMDGLPFHVIVDGLQCNEIRPGAFRGDYPWTIHQPLITVLQRSDLATTVGVP